ncbi:Mariner Mos1 transposase [Eumeta japonica]|uniref:Mariner Mos1 transposase n=1 Tax=Eumeta variegata TaxID=151549 RepID=A0A4C1YM26_EUMVA|nr:Mariner Mos1 transposase [Eumeta japonica]
MGMIQKQGHWVPYELKPRVVERHVAPSDYHLFRSLAHGLADQHFRSYEEVKNWIDSSITSKDDQFFQRRIRMLRERWEKVVPAMDNI